jgi:hypothetical protein
MEARRHAAEAIPAPGSPDYLRWRGCTRKVRYPTEGAARRAIRRLPYRKQLTIYKCSWCNGGYHCGRDRFAWH